MNGNDNRAGRVVLGMVVMTICLGLMTAPTDVSAAEDPPLITLRTDGTSVVEILQLMADRGGLNIVTGPEVQGRIISIRLSETPLAEALDLTCRAAGLGYERIGNSILVADPMRLTSPTGLTTRVFELEYADAEEIREVLEVISSDVKAEARGNRIVMWAPPSSIEQAERTIANLDRKPAQVLLEARLIEVNTSELQELGIDWEKITKWTGILTEGYHGSSGPGQIPSDIDFIKLGESEGMYRQMESFEVAIDALITEGSARLLSNARVVTLDGEPAEIFAGDTVPVVITSLQSPGGAGGVFQTVQLEKIDVGVRLRIVPRISGDGYITTLVEPEVSRIIGFVGPDDDLPQTSTRRARTLVRVQDGQTIYLGGLLSEEKRKTVKRVPLLGHIPLLGALFSHHRDETIKLDLVIEITPHIIGDDGEPITFREMPELDLP